LELPQETATYHHHQFEWGGPMRSIPLALISARVWGLFLCLLAGCAYPGFQAIDTDSGTFSDDLNLSTGKYQRRFLMHIPKGYTISRPLPLVVVLHGAFSTAREMEKWSGWSELADREGFIVIYPEGIGILGFLQHWNAGHCCGKAVEDNWDDVAFIEEAIDGTCRKYAVDRHRIYMTGFSNGGMMTHRFAAERPFLLAAAASVSGAINSTAAQNQPEWRMPSPGSSVPFLIMHGDSDKIVPYDGGKPLDRESTREYWPVSEAAEFWIAANKSASGPVRKDAFNPEFPTYCNEAGGVTPI
jgi:polyhydroxybutyrate depolymerase